MVRDLNALGATPNSQEQTYQRVLVWTLDKLSPPPLFQARVDHRRRARDRIVGREGLRNWRPRVFVQQCVAFALAQDAGPTCDRDGFIVRPSWRPRRPPETTASRYMTIRGIVLSMRLTH